MTYKVNAKALLQGVKSVPSPNTGGALTPSFLIIHYTAGGPAFDTAEYFSHKASIVSAHVVIRRDGTVIQCVPFDTVAFHAGKSEWTDRKGVYRKGLNQSAIGIEIENWGVLEKTGTGYVSWKGASVDAARAIYATHKYGKPTGGWEIYTEAQVDAAIGVARAVCGHYGIVEILGHDDISPGRKSDPGPAWNMASFRAKVFGRDDDGSARFVVRSPNGLNVRTGAGATFPLARPAPLPDGTEVAVHEAEGAWRYVSVLDAAGHPDFSGWVHGGFLREA